MDTNLDGGHPAMVIPIDYYHYFLVTQLRLMKTPMSNGVLESYKPWVSYT